MDVEDAKHLFLAHTDGVLGLVEHALATSRATLVGILLAGSLVHQALAGALGVVRLKITEAMHQWE